MPKVKTHKGASKRFRKTRNGKFLRNKAYGSHLLAKKTRKRKRNLRKKATVASADSARIKRMLVA